MRKTDTPARKQFCFRAGANAALFQYCHSTENASRQGDCSDAPQIPEVQRIEDEERIEEAADAVLAQIAQIGHIPCRRKDQRIEENEKAVQEEIGEHRNDEDFSPDRPKILGNPNRFPAASDRSDENSDGAICTIE